MQFGGDLRALTRVIAATIVFFGLVLLAVIFFAGWTSNHAAIQRDKTLVENALDQSITRVLNEQKSVAWWDDAVTNVAAGRLNTEWTDINIGMYLSETYGHAELYVVDDADQPIYSWVDGANAGAAAYSHRAALLAPLLREVRTGVRQYPRARDQAFVASQAYYRDLLGARLARWGGHIISVDGHPAVVTAITIVPNIEFDLVRGRPHMLVSIVPIDETFISDIGLSLLMPDLKLGSSEHALDGQSISVFNTDDGLRAGYLTWTPRRPGQMLLVIVLPLAALGILGVGWFSNLMFGRLKRASTELADREAQARFESKHDPLSGLPNRTHFVERLQERLDALIQVRNGASIIVAYLDVDRFKDINDTLGHEAGDTLVRSVALRLRKVIRPDDMIARFGGDEFAIMRVCNGAYDGEELVRRLRAAFEQSYDVCGQNVVLTASIGLATAPQHGMSPEELMRHADIALYQSKNQGRDRALFFCAEMAAEVQQRRDIELDLRAALESDALTLAYQPVISVADNRVTGVEALLRWRHPFKGDISPALFVPIAEEAGLMPALGAWVLNRAFQDSKRWPQLQVSINLSPVQFRHVDLTELLERMIAEHEIDPRRFALEVTEGVMLDSTERNRAMLESIRNLGFKVSLDDFGTGFSSLRYLCDFRFDKIKIDRAFVSGVHERKRAMTIIQSVVTLGRGLNMDIVAEGVETEAEAQVMRLVGVTEIQGFYFSRAVAVEEIAPLVAQFERTAVAKAQQAPANDTALISDARLRGGQ